MSFWIWSGEGLLSSESESEDVMGGFCDGGFFLGVLVIFFLVVVEVSGFLAGFCFLEDAAFTIVGCGELGEKTASHVWEYGM
ncbi:hypothetical protein HanIR_Chr14g0702631 [Helianthus annuus]|nr:hypothetical protein HanIR_Chr14g0702631 [Helianthus annuus]